MKRKCITAQVLSAGLFLALLSCQGAPPQESSVFPTGQPGPELYFTGKALVHMIYTDEKQEHRTEAYNVDSRREPARTDIRIPVDRF